ncbi:MAG: hydrogenase [Aquincola sp.]|nr:hydrogenase [Aquincola sp.]MDH5329878.1 hydrogenase [Aquincola sp.]
MTQHPLIERLIDAHGAQAVDPDTVDAWGARAGEHVLLFSGDPVRFPEALDVAVVLPQLRAACGDRFDIGVVPREHEDALARRYGVQRWPSLVFLRAGGYLATVSGMQDWVDYLGEVGGALEREVSRPPTVGIPVVAAGQPASACH